MISFYIMILGFITLSYELADGLIILCSDTWQPDRWLPFSISPYFTILIFIISFLIGRIILKRNPENRMAKLSAKISGIIVLAIFVLIIIYVFLPVDLLPASMD